MRILIVKLSSLGDLLHVLPTVHALRTGLSARIDWVVQSEYASLLRCFPDVEGIYTIRRHQGWRGFAATCRALRRNDYDLVIDLQGLQKSALVARLAGGKRCIGPSYHREGARFWYDAVAGVADRSRHAVVQAMDVLPLLGLPVTEWPRFMLQLPEDPLAHLGRPRVGLAPVSRWPSKNWPLARYAELADRLQRDHRARIVVLGGAGDRSAARMIEIGCREPLEIQCGTLDWPELGAVLAGLDVLVSNDSGPVHFAAALGLPCVVFYGPTRSERTAPWGPQHRILETQTSCAGCYRRQCRFGDDRCWQEIDVNRAWGAVDSVLGKKG